jgi:hypothetical protein
MNRPTGISSVVNNVAPPRLMFSVTLCSFSVKLALFIHSFYEHVDSYIVTRVDSLV